MPPTEENSIPKMRWAAVKRGYEGQLASVNPPPLAIFESATMTIHYFRPDTQGSGQIARASLVQNLIALPEPSLGALLLAALSLVTLRRKRAPEA
jgi:hypothetical protein